MHEGRIHEWFVGKARVLAACLLSALTILCWPQASVRAAERTASELDRARDELAAAERVHGDASVQAAAALSVWLDVATAHYWHEDHPRDALRAARRLVALRAQRDGEHSLDHARALQHLGLAHAVNFEHEQAAEAFERAATIVLGPDSAAPPQLQSWSRILRGLGQRNLREDLALAEDEVRAGLAHAATLTPVQRAAAWLNLAGISHLRQRPESSEEALSKAEAALLSAALSRHPLHADILRYRSLLALDRGDPGAALGFAQQAVDAGARAQPASASLRFISVYSLGQIEQRLGHLDAAAEWFERALQLPALPQLNGGYSKAMLQYSMCNNLLHRKLNLEAEAPCREAAIGFEALPKPMLVEACNAWNNVGVSLRLQGRESEALEPFGRAVEMATRAGPEFAYWTNNVLMNLAGLHLQRGEFAAAEKLLQQRLGFLGDAGDFATANRRSTWMSLGVAHWGLGDVAQAFDFAAQAERSAARVRRIGAADLDEGRALQLIDTLQGGLDLMLLLAAKSGSEDTIAASWEASMQAFGVETAMATRRLRMARASADPRLESVWREWQARNAALTQARIAAASRSDADSHAVLDRTERSFEAIDQELARRTGGAAAYAALPPMSLSDVRNALPKDAALVRFVRVGFDSPQAHAREDGARRARLLALIADGSAPLRIVDLGAEAVIAEAASRWYALATRADGDQALLAQVSQTLWRLAWQPLGLTERRVFVIPSAAALARINFLALQDADGRYLLERGVRAHLLNHEADLVRTPRRATTASLLLVGAPEFSSTGSVSSDHDACLGQLGALPGAAAELQALSAIAGRADMAHRVLHGRAANEADVIRAMAGTNMLHFATHGIRLGASCNPGARTTRGVQLSAAPDAGAATTPDVAALALTPGVATSSHAADDGLLTGSEIASLDLTDLDWAVLSACETALGPDLSQEGVGGLRRALALAGARSVIMSLWRVDDEATVDFMRELYRQRLLAHASTDQAVQAATGHVLTQRRARGHSTAPYYWAGFVASGDWR